VGEIVGLQGVPRIDGRLGCCVALDPYVHRKTVGLDLIAGVSLAAFVIPQSLAYTSLARLLGALVVRSASTWLYFSPEHIRRQIVDMIDGAPAEN
jgi:hypothetical protein